MNADELFLNLNSQVAEEKLLWIQGPGGNTSFKDNDRLLIKTSGTRIRDIHSLHQLAELNLHQLRVALAEIQPSKHPEVAYKEAIESSSSKKSLRPSMESGFHALLPHRYVFHIHSLAGIGLAEYAVAPASAPSFQQWFHKHWSQSLGTLNIIDFCLPGHQLTSSLTQASSSQSLYFLRNHGVILSFQDENYLKHYKAFEKEALQTFLPHSDSQLQKWRFQDALSLATHNPDLLESEIQFYFPDMAIMFSRIQKYLKPTSAKEFRFEIDGKQPDSQTPGAQTSNPNLKNTESIDLDALENWLANSMLQKLFPQLPTLSQTVCDQIISLPTELARKKAMEPLS